MTIKRDDLSHSGDPLPKAEPLTDNDIMGAGRNNQEALRMLAATVEHQNTILKKLRSTIVELSKALQKPDK
jgi:hypothetical protein